MDSPELIELVNIKRLLIALLLKFGASSQEIATVLEVDSSVIRKMFPMKAIKKVNIIQQPDKTGEQDFAFCDRLRSLPPGP